MTGKQLTRADWAARRQADREARQKRWREVEEPRFKAAVLAEIESRGLASFMNTTRWRALVDGVYAELPFPPPFQLQPVIGEREAPWNLDAVNHWGAWSELEPFFAIECLRVLPRYRKVVGGLIDDEWIDCTNAFRDLLIRLRIPFREDEAGTFWIHGYAPADPATLTPPPGTPT
ncbi:DUF6678 family protein [Brevundimonas sp.]|uniref:DUF6678 family protein n=1 Tax=Brevundimonas sp. TaxID=1871086 RepID=UPI002D6B5285|nr:DUF6678 family protein [Brevundimonas sp.]HYC67533.1 DUF6678 family protein [Brevundimonas sp.]